MGPMGYFKKTNACVQIDFFMGMEVPNEAKQKGSLFLKQPEVCTYKLLKQWRDEIRENCFEHHPPN
jgi:hypothetical protein